MDFSIFQRKKIIESYQKFEIFLSKNMNKYSNIILRYSIGITFVWFGILKPLGLSPAEPLANQLIINFTALTGIILPFEDLLFPILGLGEVLIGLLFLFKPTLRLAILLFFLQLPFTIMPLILAPEHTFTIFPYALTLEGQYIVKNLVLIAAVIAIGGSVREQKN